MSYKECKNVLGELVIAGKLSKEQAENIVAQVAERGQKARERGLDGAAITQQEAAKIAQEEIRKSMLKQRQIVLEKMVDAQTNEYLKNFKNDAEGFKALLGSALHVRGSGKKSIAAIQRARSSRAVCEFHTALKEAGVFEMVRNKLLEKEVAIELGGWSKSKGQKALSGSDDALKIATVIRNEQRKMLSEKNRYGADIRTLDDYITRNMEDPGKLNAAGYKKWREDIEPLIDKERIAKGSDLERTLEGIYKGKSSGIHLTHKVELDSGEVLPFLKRKGLAHGMSQERIFHLKDGEAWHKYNEMYGRGSLYETVGKSLEHDARGSVMLQYTGPRGGSWLQAKREQLIAANDKNPEVQKELQDRFTDALMRQVDGSANLIKSHSIAKAYWAVKMTNAIHDLGQVVFASFADLTNASRQMQHAGVDSNMVSLHFEALQNMFRRAGPGADRQIARMSSVASESFMGSIFSRFWDGDALDGKMSRYANRAMEATHLPKWTDEGKQAVGEMLSNWLGHESHLPYEKLNDNMRRSFDEYGIKPEYWEELRKHVWGRKERGDPEFLGTKHDAYEGNKFITADSVQRIDDSIIRSWVEKSGKTATDANVARFRDDLQNTFDNYIVDNVNRSFIDQSARGKAFRQGSLLKGTHYGEAVGLFWQYKAFAVEYVTQALARETYGQGVETAITKNPMQFAKEFGSITAQQMQKGEVPPIVKLMVGASLMGGFALTASNFAKGQKTDWSDSRNWKSAVLKGGGLGMYGDFMFANYDSYGNNFLTKFGGPSATRAIDVATLFSNLKDLDMGKAIPQAEKVIENQTPFLNLYYTRFATDYLFMHQIHERLSPGKLQNLEKHYQETGRGYFVPPSSVIDYGGTGTPGQGAAAIPKLPGAIMESVVD
jgi:hypothetical protein